MNFIELSGAIYDRIEPIETDFTYDDLIRRLKKKHNKYNEIGEIGKIDNTNIIPYVLYISTKFNLMKCTNNQIINLNDVIDWSSDVFITFTPLKI
jgi:hypothetical protein